MGLACMAGPQGILSKRWREQAQGLYAAGTSGHHGHCSQRLVRTVKVRRTGHILRYHVVDKVFRSGSRHAAEPRHARERLQEPGRVDLGQGPSPT